MRLDLPCFFPVPATNNKHQCPNNIGTRPQLRLIPATPVLEIDNNAPSVLLQQTAALSSYLDKPGGTTTAAAINRNSRNNSFVSMSDTVSAVSSGQMLGTGGSKYKASSSLLSGSVKGRNKVFRTQSERLNSAQAKPEVRKTSIKLLKRKRLIKQCSADEYTSTSTPPVNTSPPKATRKASFKKVISKIMPRKFSTTATASEEVSPVKTKTQHDFLEHFDKVSDSGIVENWLMSIDNIKPSIGVEETEKLLEPDEDILPVSIEEDLASAGQLEDQESLTEAKELKTEIAITELKTDLVITNESITIESEEIPLLQLQENYSEKEIEKPTDAKELIQENYTKGEIEKALDKKELIDTSEISDDINNPKKNNDNTVSNDESQDNEPKFFARERSHSLDSPICFIPIVRQLSNDSAGKVSLSDDTHASADECCPITAHNTLQNSQTHFTSEGDQLRKNSAIFRPITSHETSRSTSWISSTDEGMYQKLQGLEELTNTAVEGMRV